ncbi:MAG TPA: IS4 family transposase [Gammaproteobacteria bacterium]|nr:IS4 family transposase [Gammaproteobacteria bacterium]
MNHFNASSAQQQRRVAKQVQRVDSNHFFNLLTSPQLLDQVEAHLPDHRERQYPPTATLSMFLGQAMSADGSCQNAVNEANVTQWLSGLPAASSRTGGYCSARKRLPLEMISSLARETGKRLTMQAPPGWLWRGRPVKLVDGTTVLMPDSEDNQAHYPQHGMQIPGVGFPLARLVGVMSLSTGAVIDAAMGAYKGKGTGEYGLFRRLRGAFDGGDIMLADSYYCSYFLIADLQARGVDVLFEQHGARNTDFRRGEPLGTRDHRVYWVKPARPSWMRVEEYDGHPDQVEVREVKVGKKVLVTTFLSPRKTSKKALGHLFTQRWHVELDLRNIKTTLGMEALSCLTAQMCEKEMWVYLLAYNLIRLLMAQAAMAADVLPRALSFKHTLQVWIAWNRCQFLSDGKEDIAALFLLIAQIQVGKRPGRVEPRVVKRRPKPYPRMQVPRQEARDSIKKRGHDKKLGLN